MTIRDASSFEGPSDTSDLVRSVALSSARLWEEVIERLVRVERSQVQLARTVAEIQTALPMTTGQPELMGASVCSTPALGRPFSVMEAPVVEVLSANDALPPPPPGYAIVPGDLGPFHVEVPQFARAADEPEVRVAPQASWTDEISFESPSRVPQDEDTDPLSELLFPLTTAEPTEFHGGRITPPIAPLGFDVGDLTGADAIGARVEVPAASAEPTEAPARVQTAVTPDFFARAFRSKR
jgi:hypothetical protein